MDTIKPGNLELFRCYLQELQLLPDNNDKAIFNFSRHWENNFEKIKETALQLADYLQPTSKIADKLRFIATQVLIDEPADAKEFVPDFVSGIDAYVKAKEASLLQGDLLEKPIEQMTGFEFRTLLLATLKEHNDRQKP